MTCGPAPGRGDKARGMRGGEQLRRALPELVHLRPQQRPVAGAGPAVQLSIHCHPAGVGAGTGRSVVRQAESAAAARGRHLGFQGAPLARLGAGDVAGGAAVRHSMEDVVRRLRRRALLLVPATRVGNELATLGGCRWAELPSQQGHRGKLAAPAPRQQGIRAAGLQHRAAVVAGRRAGGRHPKMRSIQWCRLALTGALSSAVRCCRRKSSAPAAQGGSATSSTARPSCAAPPPHTRLRRLPHRTARAATETLGPLPAFPHCQRATGLRGQQHAAERNSGT